MRFNNRKFQDRATEIILSALYEYANPVDLFNSTAAEINGRKEKAIHNYQNDPMTNARVKNIVSMLSHVIDAAEKGTRNPPEPKEPYLSEDDLEALRRDAERYRWLRDQNTDVSLVLDKRTDYVPPDDAVPGAGGYWCYEYRAGSDLDDAVDAAMAGGPND